MIDPSLVKAIDSVPPGACAVGVSGGADSVALLHLLHERKDLRLVVAHLNHQTRGNDSDADARFVQSICAQLAVRCVIEQRDRLERSLEDRSLPTNPSARYRRLRFELFRGIVQSEALQGVLLAHHADDQAETVLQRMLRGCGYAALAGMSAHAAVFGVKVIRPLLPVRREMLRRILVDRNLPWREDASNDSPAYLRNRLRVLLRDRSGVTEALLQLADACAALRAWVDRTAPRLEPEFALAMLQDLPSILARRSAGRWLRERGVLAQAVDREIVDRLIEMCLDAATPARQMFPGMITVSRRAGKISGSR